MWQVISIIDGEYHHEGFFDDIHQAESHRDWTNERMFNSDVDGYAFVNEIKESDG